MKVKIKIDFADDIWAEINKVSKELGMSADEYVEMVLRERLQEQINKSDV